MDDVISPELGVEAGLAAIFGFGGGASKESKMDDDISPELGIGVEAGFGFAAGGASKESNIEDES